MGHIQPNNSLKFKLLANLIGTIMFENFVKLKLWRGWPFGKTWKKKLAVEDWCSIQANTPLYFPHRSNTPDITPAHLSSSSLLVIIKTPITHHHSWSSSKLSLLLKFSSLMIVIRTLFVLTALGKVRVFAFAVIAGPINKRMGHPGPQNCAQQMSAEHKFQFAGWKWNTRDGFIGKWSYH